MNLVVYKKKGNLPHSNQFKVTLITPTAFDSGIFNSLLEIIIINFLAPEFEVGRLLGVRGGFDTAPILPEFFRTVPPEAARAGKLPKAEVRLEDLLRVLLELVNLPECDKGGRENEFEGELAALSVVLVGGDMVLLEDKVLLAREITVSGGELVIGGLLAPFEIIFVLVVFAVSLWFVSGLGLLFLPLLELR